MKCNNDCLNCQLEQCILDGKPEGEKRKRKPRPPKEKIIHGIACPVCGKRDSHVNNSRLSNATGLKLRWRECNKCSARWTTVEVDYHEFKQLVPLITAAQAFRKAGDPNG